MEAPALARALAGAAPESLYDVAVYSRTVRRPALAGEVRWRAMPQDAALAAQELFSVLRALDAEGVRLIWVEQPPDTPEWDGVRDRLQRAAAA
jgi:L-threonylcarbamoyladenylate synthase